MMYNKSSPIDDKDYEEAYRIVSSGTPLIGVLKYRKQEDVFICKKMSSSIDFGVRGKSYGCIELVEDKVLEMECFISECKSMEVSFMMPKKSYCCQICGALSTDQELFIMNESIYCIEHQLPF